jgi:hypothetical protein
MPMATINEETLATEVTENTEGERFKVSGFSVTSVAPLLI